MTVRVAPKALRLCKRCPPVIPAKAGIQALGLEPYVKHGSPASGLGLTQLK